MGFQTPSLSLHGWWARMEGGGGGVGVNEQLSLRTGPISREKYCTAQQTARTSARQHSGRFRFP